MSAYRPYPKYKPSDVEWLGDVPVGWEVVQFKNFVNIQNGSDHKHVEVAEGYPVMGSGGIFAYASDFLYDGESVLLGRKGTIDKPLHVTGRFWTVDTMYWTKISPGASGRFTYYSALTIPFGYYSTNTALPSMTKGNLSSHLVAQPPLPEQLQIAAFLDRECGKLDALQAKQERLIELLKEKRQALISHAVTRGLDPTAKLKPSGIEWLGDVPEHWSVRKLGLISTFKGGAGFPDDHQGQTENEIPFFKVGDIVNSDGMGIMRQANHTITRETAKLLRAFIFPCGTLVFAKVGAALLLKRFRTLGQPSCIDNNMMGMTAGKDTLADFLIYVLPLLDFELIVNPGAVPSINEGQISGQRIALPPLAEQRAIVAHLDEKCGKIDQLKAKAERGIELLKERRSALISAAVTGKIDVRESLKQTVPA
jgi:type I restriction enzyme S subunit